jgi:hypothetical protein
MIEHITVLISQVLFVIFRTLNIQHTMTGTILKNVISNLALSSTWLMSISLGIKSIVEGNGWLTLTYLVSGCIGQVIVLSHNGRAWV